ncbi:transcription antitermination factor NusB [Terrilactibacillus sp. S3-3]|nr:transcription antitermination factor NusB [Terrilactibacillus sp. S3-3]
MRKKTVRETALDLLIKIEKKHAYSQLALNEALLNNSDFSGRDKALVTQLVYGVLQRKLTLNYFLESFVPRKRKIDDWVRLLLLISIYQKVFLDRIPDHAIVNEAAKIAARRGHRGIVGFVNGVLRQFLRQGPPDLRAIGPEERRLSITYSHPEWLFDLWSKEFGEKTAVAICEANNRAPRVTVRANRLKTEPGLLAERLADEGIQAKPGVLSPDALVIAEGQAAGSACFQEGLLTIQDESSMLVAGAVSPKPGMTILDACAGPGGKNDASC